jgi:LacI family gluconate utilization system Gnt-I transcriptional repressor
MVVGFSHVKVGSAIAGFFLAKGWRRFGVATGDDHRAMTRCEGFRAAVGHDVPTAIVPAPSNLEMGRKAMADLLRQDPRIEAVYCSSDEFALGAMIEAQVRGRRVPGDIAICGFGDADFAAHLVPSLTSVQVDGAAIGRRAAQLIIDRCAGKTVAQTVIDVGFRIVERESTGPNGARHPPPRSRYAERHAVAALHHHAPRRQRRDRGQ